MTTVSLPPFSLDVRERVEIAGTPVTEAREGVPYSFTVSADKGFAPYVFSVAEGELPAGIALDPDTGEVSGEPTEFGLYEDIVIRVTDDEGFTADLAPFALRAVAALAIAGVPVTTAILDQAYAGFTASAEGGVPPYAFGLADGAWPDGIGLNGATGEVSGTPTEAGIFEGIEIEVEDDLEYTDRLEPFDLRVIYPWMEPEAVAAASFTEGEYWADASDGPIAQSAAISSSRNGVARSLFAASMFNANVPVISAQGLEAFPSYTQLALQANAFGEAYWAKNNGSITGSDGDFSILTAASGSNIVPHLARNTGTIVSASGLRMASIVVRPAGRTRFQLSFAHPPGNSDLASAAAIFELSGAGSVIASIGGAAVLKLNETDYMIMIWTSETAASATTQRFQFSIVQSAANQPGVQSNIQWSPTGTETVRIRDALAVDGVARFLPPMRTTTTTLTRLAENLTISNFATVEAGDRLRYGARFYSAPGSKAIIGYHRADADNYIEVYANGTACHARVVAGGAEQANINVPASLPANGSVAEVEITLNDDGISLAVNGGTPAASGVITMPSLASLTTHKLGSDATPANHMNGMVTEVQQIKAAA